MKLGLGGAVAAGLLSQSEADEINREALRWRHPDQAVAMPALALGDDGPSASPLSIIFALFPARGNAEVGGDAVGLFAQQVADFFLDKGFLFLGGSFVRVAHNQQIVDNGRDKNHGRENTQKNEARTRCPIARPASQPT